MVRDKAGLHHKGAQKFINRSVHLMLFTSHEQQVIS